MEGKGGWPKNIIKPFKVFHLKMNYAKTIRGHMKLTYNGEAYRSIGYKNLKLQTKILLLYRTD